MLLATSRRLTAGTEIGQSRCSPMFERLSDDARSVMVLAQEEARLLSHQYLGTEHLLLGLIREERGVAAQVLETVDIHLDPVRVQVKVIVGEGDQRPSGHIPFTPNAAAALQRSPRLAGTVADPWINTEHILLAIIDGNQNSALKVLRALDVNLDTLRALLMANASL